VTRTVVVAFSQLPFWACSCVLAGFALWGWRRTGATGALLIAIAAGLRLLGELAQFVELLRLYHAADSTIVRTMTIFGSFQATDALVTNVLFIVGVALILRRLPAAKR
jgi:hypothetical protein